MILKSRFPFYAERQQELGLLNAHAARINALRKELIKTGMRVRDKNAFFDRLSKVGDRVFPRRKELIKEVSHAFIEDVDSFVKAASKELPEVDKLAPYRQEIQALQAFAKELTLNTPAFSNTRKKLSSCWDQIKTLEKEKKQEWAKQQVVLQENAQIFQTQIEELSKKYGEQEIDDAELLKQLELISTEMRKTELGRKEVITLKKAITEARRPITEKTKAEEQKRRDERRAQERAREEKIQAVKAEIETFPSQISSLSFEESVAKVDELKAKIKQLSVPSKVEAKLMHLLQPIEDMLDVKKEQALLEAGGDAHEQRQNLREILNQRLKKREEIKGKLQSLRKESGSSRLDFAQAMTNSTQMQEEKDRLEILDQSIADIEQKIAAL